MAKINDFSLYNSPAEIRKAQKKTHYTITPIADLAKWKVERQVIESEWQKAQEIHRAERKASAEGVVKGTKEIPLTDLEKAEIDYLTHRNDVYKPCKSSCDYTPQEEQVKPHKTLLSTLKTLVANIWHSAFSGE